MAAECDLPAMVPALLRLPFLFLTILILGSVDVLAQAELSTKLVQELNTTREVIPVYVMLASQANAKTILANEPARGLSKQEQVARALQSVKQRNEQAQQPFLARLAALDEVTNVRSRWIVNLVGFSASPERIREIANDPEVAAIFYDEPWEVEQALEETVALSIPDGKEPGLSAINADKMWSLGYTGFGGIAFTADTGVDPYHPAINHKYAGHDGRIGDWYSFNQQTDFPFDCDDHGTHVTGTIIGVDRMTRDTIGVAYNSHWLGGAILCGIGTADNIGAFEWAIDPDGDFNTTDDRPVVINNSWRDPSIASVECTSSNPYPTILDNLEAAGIAVVFSAGNSGPDESSITPPHNYNAGLVNAFTVGALDPSSTGIADFSSRGPALCVRDSVELDIKPEVSAPGQSVRSCLPGEGYGLKSGTSMAAPHVAGAILLLHEAFPTLDGEALKLALYLSARDLGTPGEDNTFGRGIIDVFAAYNYLISIGNTPVAPSWPSMAPMVRGMEVQGANCGGEFAFDFTIGNEGDDEINSLTYEYEIDGDVTTSSLDNLTLMQGEEETFTIEGTSSLSGNQLLRFRVLTANGETLDSRLDLGGAAQIHLSQLIPASVVMDDFGVEGPCLNSPIILSLAGTTGDSIFSYFNTSPTTGVGSVDLEQPFIVEQLTEPTTLYAVGEYIIIDGIETPDISEVAFTTTDDVEMDIVANANVRIRQATIVSNGSGRILIETTNTNTGDRVGRRSAQIKEGYNTVEIRALLEEGESYSILITGNIDLGVLANERIQGTSFADGRVDVTRAAASFFFFDIETGYEDGCPIIEVELMPDSSRTSQALAPVAIPAQVELGAQVLFSETTLASATDHRWIVDGVTYTGTGDMLSLTATTLGDLSARVVAKDENECLATGVAVADVVEVSSSTEDVESVRLLEVYPNPASSYFELSESGLDQIELRLLDVAGRVVQQWSGAQQRYELAAHPKGAYLLQLTNRDGKRQSLPLVIE